MHHFTFRLRIFLAIFFFTILCGTIGFMALEDLSFTDALYFNIVTMATVGYGDIHPITPAGKTLAIFLIIMGTGTFLGVVANATELILTRRDSQALQKKMHIIVGVYFSEVGTALLKKMIAADPERTKLCQDLQLKAKATPRDFDSTLARARTYACRPDITSVNLSELHELLLAKRNFLVNLLEHPALLEQESFTEHLQAMFHLSEELSSRPTFSGLPQSDLNHLTGDMQRAYTSLVQQWLLYMKYLKPHHPYLFSLALRTNPLNPEASPIVS